MKSGKKLVLLIMKALLPLLTGCCFFFTVREYYNPITGFFYKGFVLFTVLYAVIYLFFLRMYGGTKIDTEKPRNLILSNFIALFFANVLIYIMLSLLALRFVSPIPLMLSLIVQAILCTGLYYGFVAVTKALFPPLLTVAIITESDNDADATEKIRIHDRLHRVVEIKKTDELGEDFENLDKFESVLIGDIPHELRSALLTYCYNNGKDIMLIPSMHDILLNNSVKYIVNDKLYYTDTYNGFSAGASFIKRTFDIVLSLLGIIITSPLMAIVALLIRSYDKGPALFRQTRLTKGGRAFTIVKFRSMIQNAEDKGETYLVKDGDDRITPIGRFIRATRIDELPQLFNILKGDMSFIGPRPERPELYDIYCKECPEFRYRLKVKAGLTGYAQVYGKYNTTAADKVKLDLLYIENASILQDLQILFYTVKIIFIKDSSEGIKDVSKAAKK